jgi:replicative DNA helicase
MITIEDAARKELRYMRGRMDNTINSLKTPWKKFDKAGMDGIEWGTIITIAGMSGSGKTALLNALETGLFELNPDEKFAVLSFNFEMIARRLVGRKISNKLKMTTTQLYSADKDEPTKNLTEDTYKKASEYAHSIKNAPVWYVDIPGTVQEIRNTIEHFAMGMDQNMERGILVTLDHSILVKKFGEQNQMQTLYELAAMFNELKKNIKASFVIVSQLNRGIENVDRIQNKNLHYPQKSDVFGADALYQYSDVFMIIHRPEMLNLRAYGPRDLDVAGIIYFHFIKTREAEPFIAKMRNNLKYNEILDFE